MKTRKLIILALVLLTVDLVALIAWSFPKTPAVAAPVKITPPASMDAAWKAAPVVVWPTTGGGNGHAYQAVKATPGVSWDAAQAWAVAHGGYLATIQNEAENNFVFKLIDDPKYWTDCGAQTEPATLGKASAVPALRGPWLGGTKVDTNLQPSEDWQWVHDDGVVAFSHWAAHQPNNIAGHENKMTFFSWDRNQRTPEWNDVPSHTQYPVSFVVEYDRPPVALAAR